MDKKQEELYTVTVTVENMETGAAQTTTFQGTKGGPIKSIEARTRGTCTPAAEVLREIAGQFGHGTMDAKIVDYIEESGVWFEVARKTKKESLCRDGDGNYHLITTERAGGSKEGLQVVQKRCRKLMAEDDARYWALENLRMEEYEKAFPNE